VSASEQQEIVETIAREAGKRGLRIAAAESLTCGRILTRLGAGPEASTWLAGGVVAYDAEVKFDLLGATRGPVITDRCARELATGVAGLLKADVAVGITGCGGPDEEEGQAPGTVFIAVTNGEELRECHEVFEPDEPDAVLEEATAAALRLLAEMLPA
jgi:nicotinamide-nucleotide amidase